MPDPDQLGPHLGPEIRRERPQRLHDEPDDGGEDESPRHDRDRRVPPAEELAVDEVGREGHRRDEAPCHADPVAPLEIPRLGDEEHTAHRDDRGDPHRRDDLPALYHDHPSEHEDRCKELDRCSRPDTETVDRPIERHVHDGEIETEQGKPSESTPRRERSSVERERDEEQRRDERTHLGNPRRRYRANASAAIAPETPRTLQQASANAIPFRVT